MPLGLVLDYFLKIIFILTYAEFPWNGITYDSSKHCIKQKQICDLSRYLIFDRLSPFNCCLGVV